MKIQFSIVLLIVLSLSAFGQAPKMTAEEIVQKHLAAIGTPDARTGVKSLIAVGRTRYRVAELDRMTGIAQVGSEPDKVLLAIVFNEPYKPSHYRYEKAGFNGKDFNISLLPEGTRSDLGKFLNTHKTIFKEGLIGGTISSAWALLNTDLRQPKLSYTGTDKIGDRQVYKIRYNPRKGSGDLKIDLFFDAETFRHVRSEYKFVMEAKIAASITDSVKLGDTHYKLTEDFSNFKQEGSLVLPHAYSINYTIVEKLNSVWFGWDTDFSHFVFNQPIDPKAFDVTASK